MDTITKEQLDAKIKEIYENEKFKLDAFFFCGFPSGTPNEKLIRACERYLNNNENADSKGVAEALITELEAALATTAKSTGADNLVNSNAEIREILGFKELLVTGSL